MENNKHYRVAIINGIVFNNVRLYINDYLIEIIDDLSENLIATISRPLINTFESN